MACRARPFPSAMEASQPGKGQRHTREARDARRRWGFPGAAIRRARALQCDSDCAKDPSEPFCFEQSDERSVSLLVFSSSLVIRRRSGPPTERQLKGQKPPAVALLSTDQNTNFVRFIQDNRFFTVVSRCFGFYSNCQFTQNRLNNKCKQCCINLTSFFRNPIAHQGSPRPGQLFAAAGDSTAVVQHVGGP